MLSCAAMITRLTSRFKRRAMSRPNFVYYAWRFIANAVPTYHAVASRTTHRDLAAIQRELRDQGIIVGRTAQFLTGAGQAALADAARTILETSRSERVRSVVDGSASATAGKKDFLINLVRYDKGVPPDDPLLKVALDERLLEIVASYFGLWPTLHAMAAWLNYPTDEPPAVSQLWHRDPEDLQIIKVFIYLSDVGDQSGPFSYVPRTHSFGAEVDRARQLEVSKRLSDEEMSRVFAPSAWRVCTGPADTMILADTIGYHRGGKPTTGVRILATFTYTSATPMMARKLRISGTPAWASSAIQRFAIRETSGG
jgi:hypothetical protein